MKKAIVLLSGGQDSTTCLYWAKKNFDEVVAIGFYYGQKHKIEQKQAEKIAIDACVPFYHFNVNGVIGGSSLTSLDHTGNDADHNASHPQNSSLPASFTAGRNALFLTIAAAYGFNQGIYDIVTGVCQTDYSGYPDCRRAFIDSMEESLSLAMDPDFVIDTKEAEYADNHEKKLFTIHTPLMHLTKAMTWKLANELGTAYIMQHAGGPESVSVLDVIINDTMTDYNGDATMNEWGMGVDNNPATNLRVKGFYEAKERGWLFPSIPPQDTNEIHSINKWLEGDR